MSVFPHYDVRAGNQALAIEAQGRVDRYAHGVTLM
jgi:hypothetical protein